MDPIITAIQSGKYGTGQWLAVLGEGTIRFAKAIALGNGIYPDDNCLPEDHLNRPIEEAGNSWKGKGYFIVEVLNHGEVCDVTITARRLEGAVRQGYFSEAMHMAKELGTSACDWDFFEELVYNFSESRVSLQEISSEDNLITLEGYCTADGGLIFIRSVSTVRDSLVVISTCDGNVYPYYTVVKEDGSMSESPMRDMTKREWDFADFHIRLNEGRDV